MIKTSVIALFCEDIRVEQSNILTLIGLFPDNVALGKPEMEDASDNLKFLAKIHIYIRMNFDPKEKFESGEIHIINPDNTRQSLGEIDTDTIKKAKDQALMKGNKLAGLISRAVLAGFNRPPQGRFSVEVTLGKKKYLCGSINFMAE